MSLSTHATADHAVATPIFYAKPGKLFTKKDAALGNARVIGEKAGQLHYLTEYPTHYSRSSRSLSPDAVRELRSALRNGAPPNDEQIRLLREASRAGQVVKLNLHRDLQSFDDTPPTVKEAAAYFEAQFGDGALRSWIIEYYDRAKGAKAVWTVGDNIHADDRRYVGFDLWKYHFKARRRDLYTPQGVRHSAKCPYTRWLAIDVDNHANQPTVSRDEWLSRYADLHAVLVAEKLLYVAQVNPRNGSYQLWMPVNKWPLARVNAFAERVVAACPWVREIYPTKSKWGIICPFRADKLNLLGPGELAKVGCRPKTWCYDLVAAWRWHRQPVHINTDAVREVLARAFASGTRATPATTGGATTGKKPTVRVRGDRAKATAPMARGKLGPLRGRWLELLSDTYLDGVEPPVGSVVGFLGPQLRLFRDGETELARSFLGDVIAFFRDKNWTFSDRVENDPDELVRSLDGVCRNRRHGTDQPLTDVDKTRERLTALGFDGSFESLLQALIKRRGAGRWEGLLNRPVQEGDHITGVIVTLAKITKTDHQDARLFLRRVLNHVAQRQEMAYAVLKEIAASMKIRLSNYKTQKVLALFIGRGLIRKTRNYSRCPQWSVGNLYAVTDKVQFVVVSDPQSGGAGASDSSCINTISRFLSTDTADDLSEYADEVARLRADQWTASRIRRSLAGG